MGRLCVAAITALGFLGGCTVIEDIFSGSGELGSPASIYPRGELQNPIDSKRFVISDGQDVVGELQIVEAREEDTFVDIARTYTLGFDELVQANPDVDPWLPGEGTKIVLPTHYILPDAPREGVVLNIASKRLFYYPPVAEGEDAIVETFPIGIGREGWATPTGTTKVVSKARDPVWFVPASIRKEHAEAGDPLPAKVPPGPDNPLGHRVLGLGMPGYLIHGTNKPAGVGMRVSHGCVRLFPEDIEYLYSQVPVGTPVRIVDQPYLLGWRGDDLLLEVHPPLLEDERDWLVELPELVRERLLRRFESPKRVDPIALTDLGKQQLGFPVSTSRTNSAVDISLRLARPVENIVRYEWLTDSAET